MADPKQEKVEKAIDELAGKSKPEEISKVDRQFSDKLARLEADGDAPADMLDKLRVLWKMLKAPDEQVPWKQKALVMAALTYFVSPLDVIPDMAGKPGYFDDAMVVRIVYSRLGDATEPFRAK
jgi:uncharacterized membrane protein YkvA (DUF1232 family)